MKQTSELKKLGMVFLLIITAIPVMGLAHGSEENSTNSDSAFSFSLEEIFFITLVLSSLLLLALLKISKIKDSKLLMKMYATALIFLVIDYLLFKFELL